MWRDLLFGLRQTNSYLTVRDQRRITWGGAVSAGLVILVGLATWLSVLLLAGLGRSLMGSAMILPLVLDTAKIGSDVAMACLSNWQNWSALLATMLLPSWRC